MEGRGLALAGYRVRDGARDGALQDIDLAVALLDGLHPARGAADAHGDGRGADIQIFVLLQGDGNAEIDVAGVEQQLQLPPAGTHLHVRGGVHLGGLGLVQHQIGIAFRRRCDVVAAVQPHIFPDIQVLAAAVRDGHGPLRPDQTDRLGLVRSHGRCQQAETERRREQDRQDPSAHLASS